MTPVYQTKEGFGGDCFRAAVASILELPLEAVPCFEDLMVGRDDWWAEFEEWLRDYGLYPIVRGGNLDGIVFPGYYLVAGSTNRGDLLHQVVYKNGELVHDPHPSGDGLLEAREIIILVPIDPSQAAKRRKL